MARTDNLTNFLTDVAEAIREKKGINDTILASDFDTEIASITMSVNVKCTPTVLSYKNYTGTRLVEELECLDTSNLTAMGSMFYKCSSLMDLDVSKFNTSKVITMDEMFRYATKITDIDLTSFNTSNVTTMKEMFEFCYELKNVDLTSFDVSKVTTMSAMFNQCQSLVDLDLSSFVPNKVTTMSNMFNGCAKLANLNMSNFDTSNVATMTNMFNGCSSLINLPEIYAGKVTSISGVLNKCTKLSSFGGFKELGQKYDTTLSANYSSYTLNLSTCTQLSHESLINTIYDLYDIASLGCNTQSLILGTTNLAKLTEEEIAIATNKGWNVS